MSYEIDELRALLHADLVASGAKTPAEIKAAIAASVLSLMSAPKAEAERVDEHTVRMTFELPKLPGRRRID